MCKSLISGLFGGAADMLKPAVQQTSLTARPAGTVVKQTNTQRDPNAVISKKSIDDRNKGGVPGLGL